MKIVTLLGSPRTNGNSTAIADRLMKTAQDLGAETQTFALNKMTYKGCQACMACKRKLETCALKDDLTEVLESIRDTDVLVLATPVYFGEITAQMKMFIDRTYSYYKPDFEKLTIPSRLSPGKKLVFIQTQGQAAENMFGDIYPKYEFFFQFLGFKHNRLIRACGVNAPTDAVDRKDIMQLAEDTAHQLIKEAAA